MKIPPNNPLNDNVLISLIRVDMSGKFFQLEWINKPYIIYVNGSHVLISKSNFVSFYVDIFRLTRLPNDPKLKIWLTIKNNCSLKKIKILECNSLWIPTFVV